MHISISLNQPSALASPFEGQACGKPTNAGSLLQNPLMQAAMMSLLKVVADLLKQTLEQQGGAQSPMGGMPMQPQFPSPGAMPPAAPQGFQGKPPAGAQAAPGGRPTTVAAPDAVGGKPAAGGVKAGAPSGVPGAPDTVPQRNDKPADPSKTTDDYLDANHGLLRHLGNQEGMRDKLKERYGDWEDASRTKEQREQSAYNAARHVGIIKNKNGYDGSDRGDVKTNGKMEGCTKDGDIRDGTEMADLKNSLKGTGAEQDKNTNDILSNDRLNNGKKTSDTHVKANGTNMDNFQWGCKQAGKYLFFLPGLSNVLTGIGNSEGGFGGVLKGAFQGVAQTWKNDIEGLANSLKGGKFNPASAMLGMFTANLKNEEQAPDIVRKIAGMI